MVLSCHQGLNSDINTVGIKAIFSQRTSLELAGERLRILLYFIYCYILRFAMCLSLPTYPRCFLLCQGKDQSLCLALRHKETKFILPTPGSLAFQWPLAVVNYINSSELCIRPL